jgi:hypothetical protein
VQGEALGGHGEPEAARFAAGRRQDAGAGQLVQGLGEVVARQPQGAGHFVDAHGALAPVLGEEEHGAQRVFGRVGQQHMPGRLVILLSS